MRPGSSYNLKLYVRRELGKLGKDPKFIKAVGYYAEASFYTDTNVGTAEYNREVAKKHTGKLGLPEDEEERAQDLGKKLCDEFKSLSKSGFDWSTINIYESPRKLASIQNGPDNSGNDESLEGRVSEDDIISPMKGYLAGTYRLIAYAEERLNATGVYDRVRIGGDFEKFKEYVLRRLRREKLLRSEIKSNGFDPKEVVDRARSIYSGFIVN